MATVNFSGVSQGSGSTPTNGNNNVPTTLEHPWGSLGNRLSVLKSTVDTGATGITNTNADVYEAIYIPAGTMILQAWFVVTEAEATNTTATFKLGWTGGTTDYYIAAATCAALAVHGEVNTAEYISSADTLDLCVGTAAFTNCVVDVYALVLDMNA